MIKYLYLPNHSQVIPYQKMKYIFTFLLALVLGTALFAQNHDFYWMMGYYGGTQSVSGDILGNMAFNFSQKNQPIFQEILNSNMNFDFTNSSMCDSSGNLVCYTNGIKLFDKNHHLVENGDNLVLPPSEWGYSYPQGAVLLPNPGTNNQYIQFSVEKNQNNPTFGGKLLYHLITIDSLEKVKVIKKRDLLIQDSLSFGLLSAVKHANGRDWWVIIPRSDSKTYYRTLLTKDTIITDTFSVNEPIMRGLGQCCFSPDGTKYVLAFDRYNDQPAKVYLFDFDRCSGLLYNQRFKEINSPVANFGAGCAISADSKYLYVFHTAVTYQYDLSASDVFATEVLVGEYDNFISGLYGSFYMFGQLGADGRIYISSWVSTFHMHRINHPERGGIDCQLINHSIASPVYLTEGIPSFPNFRLGPVDGSTCDSLGFDNHPLCNWRWEQEDGLSPLQVTFTDLSSYEPTNWFWTFGDGTSSTERYPVHTFAEEGIYEVCLISGNNYSSDTLCQTLNLGVSDIAEIPEHPSVRIFPNPVNDIFQVWVGPEISSPVINIYDLSGRSVYEHKLYSGNNLMNSSDLVDGIYFYKVENQRKEVVNQGKIIKM